MFIWAFKLAITWSFLVIVYLEWKLKVGQQEEIPTSILTLHEANSSTSEALIWSPMGSIHILQIVIQKPQIEIRILHSATCQEQCNSLKKMVTIYKKIWSYFISNGSKLVINHQLLNNQVLFMPTKLFPVIHVKKFGFAASSFPNYIHIYHLDLLFSKNCTW